ncbi:MAG: hypothetical protein GY953_45045, partial [bacterium]|nr:hypothetical protein [bacterium]
LEIGFDEDCQPTLGLEAMHLDVPGLKLADGFYLGGGMAIGGLNDVPDSLVLAGKLGGKLNGAGVEALVAFGVADGRLLPLGASLEASLGPAGIPLWSTGILLTGAKGGISCTGDNEDPDNLRSYVQVDEKGSVSSQPRPEILDAPPVEPGEQAMVGAPAEPPSGTPLEFQCPQGPCPPASVGLLYQPHPDSRRYPNRIIFKFSSLNRSFIDQLFTDIDLSPDELDLMSADTLASRLTEAIIERLRRTAPYLPDELDLLRLPMRALFHHALTGSSPTGAAAGTPYDRLVKAAYKGRRGPNRALKPT